MKTRYSKGLFFLFWLCWGYIAPLHAFQLSPHDTTIFNRLLDRARAIEKTQLDSAYALIDQARQLAETKGYTKLLGDSYFVKANTSIRNSTFLNTLPDLEQALTHYRNANEQLLASDVLGLIGANHNVRDNYTRALDAFFESLNIRLKQPQPDEQRIAANYRNIGSVYRNLKDYEQAMTYLKKSEALYRKLDLPSRVMGIYNIMGLTEFDHQNYPKAIEYFRNVIDHFESRKESPRYTYSNLANVYAATGEDELAREYFDKAILFVEKQALKRPISPVTTYLRAADFYKKTGDRPKAYEYLYKTQKILEEQSAISFNWRGDLSIRLSALKEEDGAFEEALALYKNYELVKDSLAAEKNNERLSELRAIFETEQKQLEIENLRIQEARRRQERNYLVVGLALLALLGSYIGFLLFQKRKALDKETAQKQRIEKLLTDREQLISELKETQEQLIHSEKMSSLGQLTAGIAHEINNPLNFVSSGTHALQLDFEELLPLLEKIEQLDIPITEEDQKKIHQLRESSDLAYLKVEIQSLLKSVSEGVNRTEKIVKGLRTYTRKQDDFFEYANLNEALESSLLILKNRLDENIQLQRTFGNIPPLYCQIDKLNQVFVNLINNAIDAIESEGRISIQTRTQQDKVLIDIQDNGKGMDENTCQRIFEPFFTTKEVGKGTGLGLYISYSIIKQHKGDIEVKSAVGQGSHFTISLPISEKSN